ncbi:MAG: aminotransferase class I/II-fold pyridoxal phosphate-dependent enzyme [Burkholderiaceae bacterium]
METSSNDFFAPRMKRFRASPSQLAAVRVRELIAQGRDIIKLTTGEPDFPTPDHVKQAVMQCMDANDIRYTPINGTEAIRRAVQHKFQRDSGLEFALNEITVGSGTKQVLFNALMATLTAGDEVIVAAPYWTSYTDMIKLTGATPVIVNCPATQQFKMTPAQLAQAITPATKWLLFSSPSNPTGATYSAAELSALAAVLLEHPHVHLLCDDVYEHLIFDGREFATFAQVEPRLAERTIICNGVSKAYSMTGWRVGFAAGPAHIIAQMAKMQSQSTSGIGSVNTAAAVAALTGPLEIVRERTMNLQHRRDVLHEHLSKTPGVTCQLPDGAMYIYCGCEDFIGKTTPGGQTLQTDTDVVMFLLDSVGVALVQGEAYGMSPCFRASFVASEPDLIRGAALIGQAFETLK